MTEPLQSLEAFYAYALAIEREAAERYREFEHYFAARGEAVLAAICAMLARMEAGHHAQLVHACEDLEVAAAAAQGASPEAIAAAEAGARKLFYRIQESEQLLEIALEGEIRAQRFYAWVADTATDPTVRRLADEMAREEARHIRWISQAIAHHRPLRA